MTITGSRFGGVGTVPIVRFGDTPATEVVVAGDGMSLTAVVPPHAAGSVAVSVAVVGKPLAVAMNAYMYGEINPRAPTRPPVPATPLAPIIAPPTRLPAPPLAPANATPNATPNPAPARR